MSDPGKPSKRSQNLAARYADSLACGDEIATGEVIRDALERGWPLRRIYSQIFAPAHARICALRKNRSVNGEEAIQITLSHMERLRSRMDAPQRRSARVVVACVDRGKHSLEVSMMSDVFRFDGWDVDTISRAVPLEDLVRLLQERKADVLAIPVTSGVKLQTVRRIAKRVRSLAEPPAILLDGTPSGQESRNELGSEGLYIAKHLEQVLRIAQKHLTERERDGGLDGFLEILGRRIRIARHERSLTQQQLAEKANLDRTYIVAVERGRQNVTVGAVMRLAEALNVSMDELFASEKRKKAGDAIGSIGS